MSVRASYDMQSNYEWMGYPLRVSMSRTLHAILAGLLVVLSLTALGCRQTVRFAGAAVRQGPLCYLEPSAGWTFNGLDARVPPRLRPGSYPSATPGVRFLGPADLGPHSYQFSSSEQSGIVYTCRAGHLDISHIRKAADWTGYLAAVVLEHIEKGDATFEFKQVEPSLYRVELTFPEDWNDLADPQRKRIAREVSCELGQYLAWTGLTWHEILTWFGYRFKIWQSEFPSAFSWEDNYSNLLGTHAAIAALRDQSRPFSECVTESLQRWLEELGAQPAEVARQTTEAMRGRWFSTRHFFTVIHQRNFDVGIDDGYVTPRLAPILGTCEAPTPLSLPIPTLDSLARYGFSMKLAIEPRVWEERRILAALSSESLETADRLDPVVDFAQLIDYIEKDAVARGVSHADSNVLER